MKITIASGKGGTGKTFIATNLAYVFSHLDYNVSYLDCDVEEPDGHLFLHLDSQKTSTVKLKSPAEIDSEKCISCGRCEEVCSYNAIKVIKEKVLFFPELCHVCGACSLVCPQGAIKEKERKIGELVHGKSGNIDIHYALLQKGEGGMSPRLISQVKDFAGAEINIIDSPPGTACSAVETIKDSDLVILVADPTPFGVNDLKLSVQMCRILGIEPVVIVNRAEYRDQNLLDYLKEEKLEVIGEIPDDRQIAEIYSRGDLVTARSQKYREIFREIVFKISELLNQERKVKKEVKPVFQKNDDPEQVVTSRPSGENKPDELVVISGKGGTGKTSITASFAAISENKVISDCDVDASDLHLILRPEIQKRGYFSGGSEAEIIQDKCIKCGQCQEYCRFNAVNIVEEKGEQKYRIDQFSCEGCGVCALVCDYDAVELSDSINGEWFISRTRFGPMAHARLGIAEENSGQLVSLTRDNESRAAAENDFSKAIIDGSPGTGCPVIASLTGVEYAVIVTEPTVSGIHDLDRILEVADYFGIECGVVVNKADINQEMTEKIKDNIKGEENVSFLGEIPYDNKVTEAQMRQQSLIEYAPNCEVAEKIRKIYYKARDKAFVSN